MAKYATNVSGAILLPSSIQVTESISGSVVPQAMFNFPISPKYEEWVASPANNKPPTGSAKQAGEPGRELEERIKIYIWVEDSTDLLER